MKLHLFLLASFLLLLFFLSGCKSTKEVPEDGNGDQSFIDRGYFRIMFYNTENLFDTYDDTLKADEQFLPKGDKYWSYKKYMMKLNNICKVVVAVGEWDPPDIIGFCEVENRFVLEQLNKKTGLANLDYEIVHFESPDRRGIDVGLFYRKSSFKVLSAKPIKIIFPFDANKPTRDILYVKGETKKSDTLHVFVNHWPSRWGGQMESEDKRIFVASVLRNNVDSILTEDPDANIIIVGDLNDNIDNKSLLESLRAHNEYSDVKETELYNLSARLQEKLGKGTHKYQGEWGILDHIIVSGALLANKTGVYVRPEDAHVFEADFLLQKDEQNLGFKPFRTYAGFKFIGGFSDHLPIYLDLRKQ